MTTPQPPAGLAEFEAAVTADQAPAVVIIDRELARALVVYLRALEEKVNAAV